MMFEVNLRLREAVTGAFRPMGLPRLPDFAGRGCARAIAVVFLLLLAATSGRAQPVRTRILDRIEVNETPSAWQVRVRFTNPVRYLRHSPQFIGREVNIQLDNVAVPSIDLEPSFGREALTPPPGSSAPVVEVVYDGETAGGPSLDVRFTRSAKFSVQQGEDFRSLIVVVAKDPDRDRPPPPALPKARRSAFPPPPEPPERFAVQLGTVAGDAPPLSLEPLAGSDWRLYSTEVRVEGRHWRRVRLGFFSSEAKARRVLERIAEHFPGRFPGAWVTGVSRAEVREAEAHPFAPAAAEAGSETELPPDASSLEQIAPHMEEARAAMTAGELDRAVRMLTKVLSYAENPDSPEAKELLGLARERNHQLAHAKAEYLEYLELYPVGDGAARVHQRLEAMLTARAGPAEPLAEEPGFADAWNYSGAGSLSVSYLRNERFSGPLGSEVLESSTLTDMSATGRLSTPAYDFVGRFAGTDRYDLSGAESFEEGLRISSLFIEGTHRERRLSGAIGRQSANSGGVLGRFDGIRLGVGLPEGWTLGAVGGFPVNFDQAFEIDTTRRFLGLSLDTPRLFGALRGQVWAIGQRAEGVLDRAAVGAELRYTADGRFVAAFVDYDVYFGALNTALLVGNWRLGPDTDLNFNADYRNSPVLTTSNALQGQPFDTFDLVRGRVATSELRAVARDRTSRSMLGTVGVTHRFTERFQVSGDVGVSEFGSMPGSVGVEAVEGTGLEYAYGLQFIANDLLSESDVTILGLRYMDARDWDTFRIDLSSRIPFGRALRVNPRVTLDYRKSGDARDLFTVRPRLRLDLRLWKLTFTADAGLEYFDYRRADDSVDEFGYFAELGVRFDFP